MPKQVIVNTPFAQTHLHDWEEMVLALLQYCLNIHGMSLLGWPIIASDQIHAAAIVRAQLRRRVSGLGIGHLGDVHGLPTG